MEETELRRKNRRSETREGNIMEEFETDINNEKKVVEQISRDWHVIVS